MRSREDLRKNTNRSNLYLIIAAIIVILVIIFGIALHNHMVASRNKAQQFAANHFNPNVEIYGVKVGNLTVKKATQKINREAKNTVVLENRKLRLLKDNQVTTISSPQVAAYFNKQHTSMPNKQNYHYANQKLTQAQSDLRRLDKAELTYKLPNKNYQLKAKDLIDKASFNGKKIVFNKDQDLKNKIKEMNAANASLRKSYKFKVPEGNKVAAKTINVTNKTYGWSINQATSKKAIEKAFVKGTKQLNGQDYIYGLGYSTYGLGYGKKNHGIGDNYIVASIKNQELWIVRKGKVAVHLNDVVTGTLDGHKGDRTPEGVWYIMYKESPSTLRGYNDDGSKYASKVQYWMPFTLSGCGLHDASWRTDWSKTAYLNGGSHGCINIRPSEIRSVWDNVLKHEAVIIY